ncbi:sensor histidine kinase [Gilvimarinus algae]|uniref:Sensor histidine kinase n=1 Tax=Gilvimarinus algae TaxID=3058037 RepID=A0ABT8TD14_9GAMM|nr:sensor histidine kinase [Gilvimarinus sp. SDUM040014]MDO3381994.1 sensor histidine kinase [Gilvimarinus sp. SDUM040014]
MTLSNTDQFAPEARKRSTENGPQYFGNDRLYYLWLLFSAYYFIPVFALPLTGWKLAFALTGYAAFVACYISIRFLPQKLWPFVVITLLIVATLSSLVTPGASNFFMYTGFFLGVILPLGYFIGAVALIIAGTYWLGEMIGYPFLFYSLYIMIGAPTIGMIGVVERLRARSAQREQQSLEEIRALAQSLERERIARDLHDVIGHTLSTIALKAELAQKLLQREQTDQADNELTQLQAITRDGLRQVRETISGVHRTTLAAELENLSLRMSEQGIAFSREGEVPSLAPEADTALALVLKELTTNLLRHSNAKHCRLTLTQEADAYHVHLKDDGVVRKFTEGNGLRGIRERLQVLGGQFNLSIDRGFGAHIRLPITPKVAGSPQ